MIPIRKRSNRHPCYRCGIMMGYGRKIIQVYKHFGLDKAQEYVSILIKTTRTEFLGK